MFIMAEYMKNMLKKLKKFKKAIDKTSNLLYNKIPSEKKTLRFSSVKNFFKKTLKNFKKVLDK